MSEFINDTDPNNIPNLLQALDERVKDLETRYLNINSLAGLSSDLGDIQSGTYYGDVICPANQEIVDPLDPAFSGTFLSGTGFDFGGTIGLLHLGGLNAGIVEFGLSAINGQGLFGEGQCVLTKDGIDFNIPFGSPASKTIDWNYFDSGNIERQGGQLYYAIDGDFNITMYLAASGESTESHLNGYGSDVHIFSEAGLNKVNTAWCDVATGNNPTLPAKAELGCSDGTHTAHLNVKPTIASLDVPLKLGSDAGTLAAIIGGGTSAKLLLPNSTVDLTSPSSGGGCVARSFIHI
jgi:hypothetical protein